MEGKAGRGHQDRERQHRLAAYQQECAALLLAKTRAVEPYHRTTEKFLRYAWMLEELGAFSKPLLSNHTVHCNPACFNKLSSIQTVGSKYPRSTEDDV